MSSGSLPAKIKHGDPVTVLPGTINALINYVRSITPQPSATVQVSRMAGGTTFYAGSGGRGPQGSLSEPHPTGEFDFGFKTTAIKNGYSFDIKVMGGYVQMIESGSDDMPIHRSFSGVGIGENALISIAYKLVGGWTQIGVDMQGDYVFPIARIGTAYINNVLQYQVGNITAAIGIPTCDPSVDKNKVLVVVDKGGGINSTNRKTNVMWGEVVALQ